MRFIYLIDFETFFIKCSSSWSNAYNIFSNTNIEIIVQIAVFYVCKNKCKHICRDGAKQRDKGKERENDCDSYKTHTHTHIYTYRHSENKSGITANWVNLDALTIFRAIAISMPGGTLPLSAVRLYAKFCKCTRYICSIFADIYNAFSLDRSLLPL